MTLFVQFIERPLLPVFLNIMAEEVNTKLEFVLKGIDLWSRLYLSQVVIQNILLG